jgi:DNA-binding MarR family transcriptional regulator
MSSTPTAAISDTQMRTWRAFLGAHATMLRQISQDLQEAGLPPLSWYDVLATLRDAPERRPLRQIEIAERVLLSTSGLSRLLDRIEDDGLVRRVKCPTDRRSLNIELTEEGAEMLERMWPVYARGIAENFLPAFGSNANEIAAALESIDQSCKVQRAAEAEPASSEPSD